MTCEVSWTTPGEKPGSYCTTADLRAEGVSVQQASDARLQALVLEASRSIDRLTGWFFEPRALTLRLDGRGTPGLEPPFPPIALTSLSLGTSALSLAANDLEVVGAPVQPSFDAPRLALRYGTFPRGNGNVIAVGTWGYTEPDGTTNGCTPPEIRRACMLLVLRMVPTLADTDAAHDARSRWRLLEERTRDQSYRLDTLRSPGPFTGDPDIDGLLLRYRRPMGLGAA